MKNLNKKHLFDHTLPLLLWLSLGLLIAGLFTPILMVKSFWLFHSSTTILGALWVLLQHQNYGVFIVILVFSVIFPLFKLIISIGLWYFGSADSPVSKRFIHAATVLGKWSMLDVFVLANIVVAIRLGMVAQMSVQFGAYLFVAAILISMLASHRIHRLLIS